ncbi:MAG: PLP-dependent aminotransferase family protein [Dehalococcoidia bacterium]
MTIWTPRIDDGHGPLYRRIADAIDRDIGTGLLEPGTRLPPQRDLADELGIALTTVTRGYAEAERRGLVSGEVGRGTFVQRAGPQRSNTRYDPSSPIDMTANSQLRTLSESIGQIVTRVDPLDSLDYQPVAGGDRPRRAGAEWIRKTGLDARPENVLVTTGGQNAILVVLSALTQPGDVVLVEEVTYSGVKSLANMLNLKLVGVEVDAEGMNPASLRKKISSSKPAAMYTMPTLQNPTARVMSDERRRALAEIANEFEVPVVEDDSYGFLIPDLKPMSCYVNESYYLTGTSKSLASGLRIGFVHAPTDMVERLAAAICTITWMASPMLAEVVAEWIFDGTADQIVEWKRRESRERQEIAQKILADSDCRANAAAQHIWLRLPEPWSAREFVAHARMRGVLISAADDFATSPRSAPHSVRICLCTPIEREALVRGLETLVEILSEPPEPCKSVL